MRYVLLILIVLLLPGCNGAALKQAESTLDQAEAKVHEYNEAVKIADWRIEQIREQLATETDPAAAEVLSTALAEAEEAVAPLRADLQKARDVVAGLKDTVAKLRAESDWTVILASAAEVGTTVGSSVPQPFGGIILLVSLIATTVSTVFAKKRAADAASLARSLEKAKADNGGVVNFNDANVKNLLRSLQTPGAKAIVDSVQ